MRKAEGITREEWIKRCAERLMRRAELTRELAMEIATTDLDEMCNGDLTENPEDIADEEMSYWAN